MKFNFFFLTILVCGLLTACSDSSSTQNGSPAKDNNELNQDLGYKPSERWPEQGEFSYSFDYSYNGNRCKIEKQFGNKADYCIGLQDSNLNNGCAAPLRKQSYQTECGDDFQEINFKDSFYISGFDERLQKRCETASSSGILFKTTKNLCDFLKNEDLHKNCFWDRRLTYFRSKNCTGSFSQEPSQVGTSPNNPTQPAPIEPVKPLPPEPTDGISDLPVVQYLRAQGVEVTINWQAIRQYGYSFPGEPPVEQKLNVFLNELDSVKENLVQKKINSIDITIYTTLHFRSDKLALFLDFDTPTNTLKHYIPLLDQVISIYKQYGTELSFIHNSSSKGDQYLQLKQVLSLIQNNLALFKEVSIALSKISFNSFTSYYPYSKELILKEQNFETEFINTMKVLKPMSPFLKWARNQKIKLDLNFEFEKEQNQIPTTFQMLEKSIKSLQNAALAGLIEEIKIDFVDYESSLSDYSKKLSLNLSPNGLAQTEKYLKALGVQGQKSTELGRKIKYSGDLDLNYLKKIELLNSVTNAIKSKINSIQQIELSYESSYASYNKTLRIGHESTVDETLKVIQSIK